MGRREREREKEREREREREKGEQKTNERNVGAQRDALYAHTVSIVGKHRKREVER